MLDRVMKVAETWLTKAGTPIDVIAKLSPTRSGSLEIVIQPRDLPSVAELNFVGNKVVDTQKLRDAMAGPAVVAAGRSPRRG